MKTVSLCGTWRVWGRSEIDPHLEVPSIEAHVPGDIPLDLSFAGILPSDLYYGKNILEIEKYEAYEWWYEKKIDLSADDMTEKDRAYLVFEGVDCLAEYFLNGVLIGKSENAFIFIIISLSSKLEAELFSMVSVCQVNYLNTLIFRIGDGVVRSSSLARKPRYAKGASVHHIFVSFLHTSAKVFFAHVNDVVSPPHHSGEKLLIVSAPFFGMPSARKRKSQVNLGVDVL